ADDASRRAHQGGQAQPAGQHHDHPRSPRRALDGRAAASDAESDDRSAAAFAAAQGRVHVRHAEHRGRHRRVRPRREARDADAEPDTGRVRVRAPRADRQGHPERDPRPGVAERPRRRRHTEGLVLSMNRNRRRESGLTLVEMLIAVALLGIVLLGIAPLFIASVRSNYAGNEYTSIHNLARDRLEQLMNLPVADPQLTVGAHANDLPPFLPDPATGTLPSTIV